MTTATSTRAELPALAEKFDEVSGDKMRAHWRETGTKPAGLLDDPQSPQEPPELIELMEISTALLGLARSPEALVAAIEAVLDDPEWSLTPEDAVALGRLTQRLWGGDNGGPRFRMVETEAEPSEPEEAAS